MSGYLRGLLTVVTVRGSSMAPSFRDTERIVVARRRAYRPGDVIVFAVRDNGPPPWRIKRVSAIAGDPVPAWVGAQEPLVPAGTVVVHGDNACSQDSRQLGFVPVAAILGRVVGRRGNGTFGAATRGEGR